MFESKSAEQWFDEYGKSHQNPTNKLIHWFMVPAIYFSIIGLFWSIPRIDLMASLVWINWATIAMTVAMIFYIRMSIPIMIGMLMFTTLCFYFINFLNLNVAMPLWELSLIIFIIAWIFQFIGHKIEGRQPSFLKNIQFLLVGPAWLMGFIYKKLGIGY